MSMSMLTSRAPQAWPRPVRVPVEVTTVLVTVVPESRLLAPAPVTLGTHEVPVRVLVVVVSVVSCLVVESEDVSLPKPKQPVKAKAKTAYPAMAKYPCRQGRIIMSRPLED